MTILRFIHGVFRRALRNLATQRRLHTLALSVMALALCVLGLAVIIALNLEAARSQLSVERRLTAFVSPLLERSAVAVLVQQVKALPRVQEAAVMDAAGSREFFRRLLGDREALLDGLAADVVPAVLEIQAETRVATAEMAALAKSLAELDGVEEVVFAREELERLGETLRVIELVALVVGTLIALITLIVVANTLRLTVLAREQEIAIQKLVGATDAYVRLPFVVEGLCLGLLAGVLAALLLGMVGGLFAEADGWLPSVTTGWEIEILTWPRVLALCAIGGGLGVVGGVVAVGRCLKEVKA